MKISIVQTPYSNDYSKTDEYIKETLNLFDELTPESDIIVFPESTDIPCLAKTYEQHINSINKYSKIIINKAIETAKRCKSIVFVNATDIDEGNYNTTFAIDKNGDIVGKYKKQHLTPSEIHKFKRVSDYCLSYSPIYTCTIDNLKFCFLTCYDNYFYEIFPAIAKEKPDFIISCSHQRSDLCKPLEFMAQFCAYNTNAYILRASVSMGENSETGGCSMIVSPKGEIIFNMRNEVGIKSAEINPAEKYYKPAGYGNSPTSHFEYTEKGRRPYKYRPSGSFVCQNNIDMPYPRICAHRGFNTVAPENSLPAFGAAISLGAQEIEFDLWETADGEIVSTHDRMLERVSNGAGFVNEHTYKQLLEYDFGIKYSEKFKGLKILKFEEILQKFACHTIMNIHIKDLSTKEYKLETVKKIITLLNRYDCVKYCYIMNSRPDILKMFKDVCPEIQVCMGGGGTPEKRESIVERAIECKCEKLQFFYPHINKEMIDKAHKHNIICNLFYCDTPKDAKKYLDMGVDTILTNDYFVVSQILKERG